MDSLKTMDVVRAPMTGPEVATRLARMRTRCAAVVTQTGMRQE